MKDRDELLLSEYFFYRGVLGKLVKDERRMFDVLSEIFLIDRAEREALYAATNNELIADVKTYADYLRLCRIQKYSLLMGYDGEIPPDAEEITAVKGEALRKAHDLKLDGAGLTGSAVYRTVADSAACGVVPAMRVYGYILCEGIYAERDVDLGMSYINKAARWNSVEGILAALYFRPESRAQNIDRLHTVTDGTVYRALTELAQNKYGVKANGVIRESVLLNKAFALGKLKPELYAAPYARIIFSDVLTFRDKERTMFSGSEKTASDIADLPLKLSSDGVALDLSALSGMPIVRVKAEVRVRQGLANSDLLTRSAYRPLCVCADSEYVRAMYAKHIAAVFGKAHVEYIDISALDGYDLQPTGKNIFVRSCDEDAFNVYIMTFTGNIDGAVMQEAVGFLQSRRRKKFCLLDPGVIIDLSVVLPVCFCDKANAKELKKWCDVITIDPISAAEKPAVFNDMALNKQRLYGVRSVEIDDGGAARLAELSVDGAESVIDAVVRFNRGKAQTVITRALIDECAATGNEKNRYGFGGDGDEI